MPPSLKFEIIWKNDYAIASKWHECTSKGLWFQIKEDKPLQLNEAFRNKWAESKRYKKQYVKRPKFLKNFKVWNVRILWTIWDIKCDIYDCMYVCISKQKMSSFRWRLWLAWMVWWSRARAHLHVEEKCGRWLYERGNDPALLMWHCHVVGRMTCWACVAASKIG